MASCGRCTTSSMTGETGHRDSLRLLRGQ
jgi:hypothetical protein